MNRRSMFGKLAAICAGTMTVQYAPPQKPERPLYGIAPFCPKCGAAAMFDTAAVRMQGKDPYAPGTLIPVVCGGCGWTGESPFGVTVPQ